MNISTPKAKRLFLLLLVLFATACSEQKYMEIEGYYNQSGFEISAGFYLLKNKTFYYVASFGNVDLKVYGTYKITLNNSLTFYPDKSLMDEFYFYEANYGDGLQISGTDIYYYKPHAAYAEKLSIKTQQDTIKFPEFTSNNKKVSIKLNKPQSKHIELFYPDPDPRFYTGPNSFKIEYNDGMDEIHIYHNYYAQMTQKLSQADYKLKDGTLIVKSHKTGKSKIIKKSNMEPAIVDEIERMIKEKTNNRLKPFIRDGKEFKRLSLVQ